MFDSCARSPSPHRRSAALAEDVGSAVVGGLRGAELRRPSWRHQAQAGGPLARGTDRVERRGRTLSLASFLDGPRPPILASRPSSHRGKPILGNYARFPRRLWGVTEAAAAGRFWEGVAGGSGSGGGGGGRHSVWGVTSPHSDGLTIFFSIYRSIYYLKLCKGKNLPHTAES